jgi:hypothetical protein
LWGRERGKYRPTGEIIQTNWGRNRGRNIDQLGKEYRPSEEGNRPFGLTELSATTWGKMQERMFSLEREGK